MKIEDIEFKDGYDEVEQEKVRSIRMRDDSFKHTLSFWEKHRLNKLQNKLEKAKEQLLTKAYKTDAAHRLSDKTVKKLEKKATAVARMEEEIKYLTGEYVPEDYVANRAIKLKANMMENLRFNSNNVYSIGLDKADAIFSDDKEDKLDNAVDVNDEIKEDIASDDSKDEEVEKIPVVSEDDTTDYEKDNALADILQENEQRIADDVRKILEKNKEEKDTTDEKIDVVPSTVERQQIKDAVDGLFRSVEIGNQSENSQDIVDAIESRVNEANEMAAKQDGDDESLIGKDDMKSIIDEEIDGVSLDDENVDRVSDDEDATEREIDYDDIKSELDKAMDNVRISKNGTAAKLDKFDEEGQVKESEEEVSKDDIKSIIEEAMADSKSLEEEKKYDYKPMTDDEIARARENIEFDKYEKIYHDTTANTNADDLVVGEFAPTDKPKFSVPEVNFDDIFKPVASVEGYGQVEAPTLNFTDTKEEDNSVERELPMVVPERYNLSANLENQESYSNDETDYDDYSAVEESQEEVSSNDDDLHFDYSTATADEVKSRFTQASSLSEFAELRKRAEMLKEEQRKSREARETEERRAEEIDRIAREKKEAVAAKEKEYAKRLEKLRMYTEALADDCKFNENKAELAKNVAEANERFVQEQEEKARSMESLINEIDSIIEPEAINVRRGK